MAKKLDMKDVLAKRSPLTPRQAITPVELYPTAESIEQPAEAEPTSGLVDKSTNIQGDTAIGGQVDKPTHQLVDKSTYQQPDFSTQQERDTSTAKPDKAQLDRYTTYLKKGMRKAIQREAFERDINDYVVVQEALEEYFNKRQ